LGIIGKEEEIKDPKAKINMGEVARDLGILPPNKKLVNKLNIDTMPYLEGCKSIVV